MLGECDAETSLVQEKSPNLGALNRTMKPKFISSLNSIDSENESFFQDRHEKVQILVNRAPTLKHNFEEEGLNKCFSFEIEPPNKSKTDLYDIYGPSNLSPQKDTGGFDFRKGISCTKHEREKRKRKQRRTFNQDLKHLIQLFRESEESVGHNTLVNDHKYVGNNKVPHVSYYKETKNGFEIWL